MHRLPGQLFLTHSSMVDKARHDNSGLDKILRNAMVVNILVRMMDFCPIIDFILDELEGRQSNSHRSVIAPSRIAGLDQNAHTLRTEKILTLHPGQFFF